MTCFRCKHGAEDHAANEPRVCRILTCNCEGYQENNMIPSDYQVQLGRLKKVKQRISWILINCKFSRNFNNKYFVFFYWQLCDSLFVGTKINQDSIKKLTDPEVIRRCKQKLVEENLEKYGTFNPSLEEAKIFKQYLIEEFVTTEGDYEKPLVSGIPPDWEN